MYWIIVKPVNTEAYKVEIVNEVIFTLVLHLMPCYSVITNQEHKYNIGFIFICLYVGLFAFNLLVILVPMICECKAKCKTKIRKSPRFIKAKAKATECKVCCREMCSKKKVVIKEIKPQPQPPVKPARKKLKWPLEPS
jgi:hypothetical protein